MVYTKTKKYSGNELLTNTSKTKINHNQNLDSRDYYETKMELSVLEKYEYYIGDFNSPINTPSSSTSKSSTSKSSTSKSSTSINIKKTKTIKRKEEKICPPGKELNPKTNRCIKIKPVSIRKLIREQKKKLKEELSKKTKVCPPGKKLNEVTGRCNKIKTKTVKTKECPPGKELNQITGRCIKIKNKTIKIKK